VLGALPARAAESIAVIDYQTIFDQYEGTADAQQTLDREVKEWENQIRDMRSAIETLEKEIDSQRLMLSADRLKEKQDTLDHKKQEYEKFTQDTFGTNGKAARRNAELTTPIAEKILDVIAKIGQEKGLSIILDSGTGGVVWAKDDVNITQAVVDDLRISVQKKPGPSGPSGPSGPAAAPKETGKLQTPPPPPLNPPAGGGGDHE
jgi:Skp family chaperone for outer membrane proteins